jgi:hypothetical protein
VTPDSKVFVAVLLVLEVAGIALFLSAKVRMAFGVNAVWSLLILLVTISSWSRITAGDLVFVAWEGSIALCSIAGAAGRISARVWWFLWAANLLMLAFLAYGAFFFHIFA